MVIDDLIEIAEKERASRKKYVVRCCMAAGCMSSNSKGVKEGLEKAVKEAGLEDQVEVRGVGCMKLCCQGPLVQVDSAAEGATVEISAARAGPALPEGHAGRCGVAHRHAQRRQDQGAARRPEGIRSSPSRCPSCWPTAASWTPNASSPTSRRTATRRCTTCCAR